MENAKIFSGSGVPEINLKGLVKKFYKKRWWFLISVGLCVALAFVYIKVTPPTYEVATSLLIDVSGKSRMLGESQYVEGGVGLIEPEKNLFNEIGVIKSFKLIEQTVRQLKFDVSYYSEDLYRTDEHYGYFPFQVEVIDTSAQLYGTPIYIAPLSDKEFQLTIDTDKFAVSNPSTGSVHEVEKEMKFTRKFEFGKEVVHNYFHFIVHKPEYQVIMEEFEDKALFFVARDIGNVANAYQAKLEVEQTDLQNSILKLATKGSVPAKEADFLDALSKNYIQRNLTEREEIARNKEAFIEEQLDGVTDSLAKAELNIEAFRRSTQALNLSQTASNVLNQSQELKSQKAQLELNIKYYNSQLQYLTDSTDINKIIAPSVVGINDPLLNENLLELKQLYSEKSRLQYYKGAKSYDLEIVEKQISNTKKAVQENLRNLIQSTQLSLADINSRINGLEGTIASLPSSEKQLLNYERKSSLYENLFNYLSQELAKTGIARAEDIPDTKVLEEARMVGNGPIAPNKNLILAMALLIGLVIPMGFIIVYESFDETIRDAKLLENSTRLPIAASIAHYNSKSGKPFSDPSNWQVQESFRDLSANLQFLMPDRNKNVIGMASTLPGEGKTFCAVNLAIDIARGGKKTLLIDTDFRVPSLLKEDGEVFEMQNFAKFLRGEDINMDELIQPYRDHKNLEYIPTSIEGENPHELLTSPRMEELISTMSKRYEYVIIDSPALGLVSDYLLVSKFVDIHLFVLRRGLSKLSFLSDLEKLRQKGKMEKVYLIFNDAAGSNFKYGYADYRYDEKKKSRNPIRRPALISNLSTTTNGNGNGEHNTDEEKGRKRKKNRP